VGELLGVTIEKAGSRKEGRGSEPPGAVGSQKGNRKRAEKGTETGRGEFLGTGSSPRGTPAWKSRQKKGNCVVAGKRGY